MEIWRKEVVMMKRIEVRFDGTAVSGLVFFARPFAFRGIGI